MLYLDDNNINDRQQASAAAARRTIFDQLGYQLYVGCPTMEDLSQDIERLVRQNIEDVLNSAMEHDRAASGGWRSFYLDGCSSILP